MATLSEHVAAIEAAIQAARDDGCVIDPEFYYVDWWGELKVSSYEISIARNKRDKGGIMHRDESMIFLDGSV